MEFRVEVLSRVAQNMLSGTGCVLLLYRTYPIVLQNRGLAQIGLDLKENVNKTMGDEMLCVYSHWRPWGGLEPIQVDTIKSTMDYDFIAKEGVQRVIATPN